MCKQLEDAYKLAVMRGFFRIAARIKRIEIAPSPMGTAHTDGSRIVFDPEFLNRLDTEAALFIAAHEYYHIIYDHVRRGREARYNHALYNIACDVIINEHLLTLGFKRPDASFSGVFRDAPLFQGMPANCNTSDRVYAWLLKNCASIDLCASMGDMIEGADADADPRDAAINRHDRMAELGESKTESSKKESRISLGEFEFETNKDNDWIDLITAMRMESGRLVERTIKRSYSRPCRRGEPAGIALPASRCVTAMPKIDVYVDVSGSMNETPRDILAGLKSILSHMAIYRPSFYAFNTDIFKIDIKSDKIGLGGGTDIKKVIKKVNEEKADLAIIITDCEDSVTRSDFGKNIVVVSNNSSMADFFTEDWKKVKKV